MDILIYLATLFGLGFVIWKAVSIHLHNEAVRDRQLESQRRRVTPKSARKSWIEPSDTTGKAQEVSSISQPALSNEEALSSPQAAVPEPTQSGPAAGKTPSSAVNRTAEITRQHASQVPHTADERNNAAPQKINTKPGSKPVSELIAKGNAKATDEAKQQLESRAAEQAQKEQEEALARTAAEKKKQELAQDNVAIPSRVPVVNGNEKSGQSDPWRERSSAPTPAVKAQVPSPAPPPKDQAASETKVTPDKLTSKKPDTNTFNLDEDGFLSVSSEAAETVKETLVVNPARPEARRKEADDGQRLLSDLYAQPPKPKIRRFASWMDAQIAGAEERKKAEKERSKPQAAPAKDGKARWISPGEAVEVAGVKIQGGLFYFGKKLDALKGHRGFSDASLINPGINVTPMPMSYNSAEMGYWPSFNGIKAKDRGAYLSWLASDRTNPDVYIGYVFLYFYGLERRVLHDKPPLDEVQQIFDEVLRLLSIYGENYSFNGYATGLAEWIALTNFGHVHVSHETIRKHGLNQITLGLLGFAIKNGEPINEDLALLWFFTRNRGIAHKRAPREYEKLFKIRYRKLFGDGLSAKENKKRLVAYYFPASPTLVDPGSTPLNVCDVSQIQGPMNKMTPIGDSCRDDLLAYGRAVENGNGIENPALKLSLLPSELIDADTLPELDRLKAALSGMLSTDGLVPVSALWSLLHHHNKPLPDSLKKGDLAYIEGLLSKLGYGYAPNPNLHYFKPQPNAKIAIYPLHEGIDAIQSETFGVVLSTIWLGSAVAAADDVVHEKEISLLQRMVQNHNELTLQQKPSLLALLQWQVNSAVSKSKSDLKRMIDAFPLETKTAIGNMLVEVALADGTLSAKEMKELERLYRGLGLETSSLASKVHSIGTQGNEGSHAHTYRPATAHAGEDQSKSVSAPQEFKLDASILAKHETDTAEVQSMLGKIFTTMDTDVADEPPQQNEIARNAGAEGPQQTSLYPGLDPALSHVVDKMVTGESWTGPEVEGMCKAHGLMVGAALEAINDWAFDTLDEALIDANDDGSIDVEMDIAAEVLKLREDA